MKYWVKYILMLVIVIAIVLLIKFIPLWITFSLLGIAVGSHIFYRYLMCKDVIK